MYKKALFITAVAVQLAFPNSALAIVGGRCDPAAASGCGPGEQCIAGPSVEDPGAPGTCQDVANFCALENVFTQLISIAGGLVGLAFFMMVVFGGYRYMFSGGDPKAVQSAKGTLTWGVLGLAFFALSFTILLLIKTFTGVDVTTFKICGY